MNIENPMVIDSLWRSKEQEPQVYGECAGCEGDIFHGEGYYEIETVNGNEKVMVHQKPDCCMTYVSEMSWCRTAGE
jgi:hypothetical protein